MGKHKRNAGRRRRNKQSLKDLIKNYNNGGPLEKVVKAAAAAVVVVVPTYLMTDIFTEAGTEDRPQYGLRERVHDYQVGDREYLDRTRLL